MSAEEAPEPGNWGVWHYPHLEGLESFILHLADEAMERLVENDHQRSDTIDQMVVQRIIIRDEWGRGNATPGEYTLRFIVFFDVPGVEQPHLEPELNFEIASRTVAQSMEGLIVEGDIDPPEDAREWFTGVEFEPSAMSRFGDQVNLALGKGEGNRVFDLTRAEAIEFREGVQVENLPRIPLEELRTEHITQPDPEESEVVTEDTEEEDDDIDEQEEEEQEEEVVPGVPEQLQPFAVDEETLEVPVGKKTTKTVEPRPPYDFEIIMATDRPSPEELPFRADAGMVGEVMSEIGEAVRANLFDPNNPNSTSPGSFPHSAKYIRNYLKFQGPAYALQMHKDLLIYTQYVNSIWGYKLRPGDYQSFRDMIYVLKEMPERGGPELITTVPQESAAAQGLEVTPDHPALDGQKAPWLENRQFYSIVEDNEDHEAWLNPFDYLYEGDE